MPKIVYMTLKSRIGRIVVKIVIDTTDNTPIINKIQ